MEEEKIRIVVVVVAMVMGLGLVWQARGAAGKRKAETEAVPKRASRRDPNGAAIRLLLL